MIIEIAEGDVALRSLMILEDEALVAMMIESVVRELGVECVESFASCAEAREMASSGDVDCAVLDVMVRDGATTEIADILTLRGIPFVFSTGSTLEALPERFRHLPMVTKPFSDDTLKLAVLDAVASRRSSPAGFTDGGDARVATSSASD